MGGVKSDGAHRCRFCHRRPQPDDGGGVGLAVRGAEEGGVDVGGVPEDRRTDGAEDAAVLIQLPDLKCGRGKGC